MLITRTWTRLLGRVWWSSNPKNIWITRIDYLLDRTVSKARHDALVVLLVQGSTLWILQSSRLIAVEAWAASMRSKNHVLRGSTWRIWTIETRFWIWLSIRGPCSRFGCDWTCCCLLTHLCSCQRHIHWIESYSVGFSSWDWRATLVSWAELSHLLWGNWLALYLKFDWSSLSSRLLMLLVLGTDTSANSVGLQLLTWIIESTSFTLLMATSARVLLVRRWVMMIYNRLVMLIAFIWAHADVVRLVRNIVLKWHLWWNFLCHLTLLGLFTCATKLLLFAFLGFHCSWYLS